MTRRKYKKKFKIEPVRLADENEVLLIEVVHELGVHSSTLYKWRRQYFADVI